jgi:hypothetical protein
MYQELFSAARKTQAPLERPISERLVHCIFLQSDGTLKYTAAKYRLRWGNVLIRTTIF